MLIWVDCAPKFQQQSDNELIEFIDETISCQKPIENPVPHLMPPEFF